MDTDNRANPLDPGEVLRRWFEAHASGDLAAASALMAPSAQVRVPGADLAGFDALMDWYADRRREQGPAFRYDVVDILAGHDHAAAAILTLSDTHVSWRQVAVYRIVNGLIDALSAYEDQPVG